MGKCRSCGGDLAPVPVTAFTWVTPRRMLRCVACHTLWAEFTLAGGEPLVLNLNERPPAVPFSEWVQEQLDRHQAV